MLLSIKSNCFKKNKDFFFCFLNFNFGQQIFYNLGQNYKSRGVKKFSGDTGVDYHFVEIT